MMKGAAKKPDKREVTIQDVLLGKSGCASSSIMIDEKTGVALQARPHDKLREGDRDSSKGVGLIAKQDIKEGTKVTYFEGDLKDWGAEDGFKSIQLKKDTFLHRNNAKITGSGGVCNGLAWLANNASLSRDGKTKNNTTIRPAGDYTNAFLRATRDIKCNEEIFAAYQVRGKEKHKKEDEGKKATKNVRGRPRKDPSFTRKFKREAAKKKREELGGIKKKTKKSKKRRTKGRLTAGPRRCKGGQK